MRPHRPERGGLGRKEVKMDISIAKDLSQIQHKFVFGLTKRQFICFGAAAAMGLPLFFLSKGFLPTSAAALVMIIVMLPWFMFAMYQKNGQPLEKYLQNIIAVKHTRPQARTYQTNNLYAAIGRQIQLNREVRDIVSNKNT